MRRFALIAAAFCCAAWNLAAVEQAEEPAAGRESRLGLSFTASSLPEAKLSLDWENIFPVLRGKGPLTRDNNLRATLGADLTPVSLEARASVRLTPVAFFYLDAGFQGGSGWNITLFGKELAGIGLSKSDSAGKARIDGSAFDGFIGKAWGGAALQFDAAALWPGDWHHIVLQNYHEINYTYYSRAGADDSWYRLADDGENRNGWNYYVSSVIGYQMPRLPLDMVALMLEQERYLTRLRNGDEWGDEVSYWVGSVLAHVTFSKSWALTAICQFQTARNWEDNPAGDTYYRNCRINRSDPLRVEFYRAAAILDWTIR